MPCGFWFLDRYFSRRNGSGQTGNRTPSLDLRPLFKHFLNSNMLVLAAIISGVRTHGPESFLGRGRSSVQIMYWTFWSVFGDKPHQWQKWIQKETSLNVAYTILFILNSSVILSQGVKSFLRPRPSTSRQNKAGAVRALLAVRWTTRKKSLQKGHHFKSFFCTIFSNNSYSALLNKSAGS